MAREDDYDGLRQKWEEATAPPPPPPVERAKPKLSEEDWARINQGRVEHFAITPRILRILMEHIEIKNSLDSKLQTFSICSIRILNILEVIAKTSFSKI